MSLNFANYRSASDIDFVTCRKLINQVPILDVKTDRLLEIIRDMPAGCADYMVTPNVDHFRLLDEPDGMLLKAYKSSALIVCDSRILRFVSRIIPGDTIENINPGSDVTRKLLGCSWFANSRIAVIGSGESDIAKLRADFSLSDISVHVPPMGFIRNEKYVQDCLNYVLDIDPDYLLVAVGCPQGEILANKIFLELKGRLSNLKMSMCVGASLDFAVGKQKRAPLILQKTGFEWFYRLATNYSRLKGRYYSDLLWLFRFFVNSLYGKNREV